MKPSQEAAANIAAYHDSQVEAGISLTEIESGLTLGYKATPITSVGVYVPGGTAAYLYGNRKLLLSQDNNLI